MTPGVPGSMQDPRWLDGFARLEQPRLLLGPARAVLAPARSRRRGGRVPADTDRPEPHRLPVGSEPGRTAGMATGDGADRRAAERLAEGLGVRPEGPALGLRVEPDRRPDARSRSSASNAACSPATSPSPACASTSTPSCTSVSRMLDDSAGSGPTALLRRERGPVLSAGPGDGLAADAGCACPDAGRAVGRVDRADGVVCANDCLRPLPSSMATCADAPGLGRRPRPLPLSRSRPPPSRPSSPSPGRSARAASSRAARPRAARR